MAFDLPGFGRAPRLVIRGLDDYLYYEHVLSAAEFLAELTGLRSVLVGHSMGGRISLQAAARGREDLIAGVVTLAGLYDFPTDPAVMSRFLNDFASFVRVRFEVAPEVLAEQIASGRPTLRAIEALKVPFLAVEAGLEQYSFIRETRYELFRRARCPKTLVLLGKADHKFKGHYDAVSDIIEAWVERRVLSAP